MPDSFLGTYRDSFLTAFATLDLAKVAQAVRILREARDQGRAIFVCGNGGSASTASHFATELVKGASYGRARRFRIVSLNDSISTVTAYSNDAEYACAYAEQLKNFAQPGDVAIAFSSSGNSPSVVRFLECANELGCQTIAFTGRDGGKLGAAAGLDLRVPHQHLGRCEDVQFIMSHMICYYFMENPEA